MTPLLETVTLFGASVIAGLLMGFLHYFIPKILGRDLAQPWTYVVGVGFGIALPFAGWCLLYGALVNAAIPAGMVVVAFASVVIGAGLVTLVCYDADHRARQREKAKEDERRIERGNRLLDDTLK